MVPAPAILWLTWDADWLANISVKWVLVVVGLLLLLRFTVARIHPRQHSSTDTVTDFVESALIAIVLVFLIVRPFGVQAFHIPSESMVPTLQVGDRILVNKFLYRFGEPGRNEVVVFRAPHEVAFDEKDFIKRIVAGPGDVIEAVPDRILADDRVVASFNADLVQQRRDFEPVGEARRLHPEPVVNPKIEALGGQVSVRTGTGYRHDFYLANPAGLRVQRNGVYLGDRLLHELQLSESARIERDLGSLDGDPDLDAAVVLINEWPRFVVAEGERLYVDRGHLIVNGEDLRESVVYEPPTYAMEPREIPPGEYFVVGDNRNDSNDSHHWGTLDGERIIGRAEAIFWPPGRIGRIR